MSWRHTISTLLLVLPGCVVDTGVPHDAQLTCAESHECPDDWACDGAYRRPPGYVAPEPDAEPDGGGEDEEIPRHADKVELCSLFFAKVTECEAESRALLGDTVYALFETDEDAFVHQDCVPDLMSQLSDTEFDELWALKDLLPPAPCSMFAPYLCDLFTAARGYETNCE